MRGKILVKKLGGAKQKIKIRYLILVFGLVGLGLAPRTVVQAVDCPELKIIFARGSGSEINTSKDYLEFKKTIEEKVATTKNDYEFIDLDYPAIGVSDLEVLLGAFFGAGDAYEFGASVKSGVENLVRIVNSDSCPATKYVLGGYSQGAMVVSRALGSLNAERIIYAATFGDPKLYLPEGKGLMPAACKGENLSDYRMYVPDCQAYKGLLGAYIPYEPLALEGKVGTWCNKMDIFCSSHLSISDHVSYVADNLYEDASRVIFDKIADTFGIENIVSSPHDTAILIDSTGSMSGMIEKYKAEALRLAQETLDAGGRVALYDYRDLDDPYQPVEHCDFESCDLETFKSELDTIQTDDGGDAPESLLSGSLHVMQDLEWRRGSTKSLVVLTDADFLSPDRDGVTFDEVVKLSKQIDPVNFYIITTASCGEVYTELADQTGGKVVTNFDELSLLTDYIMERYDSLPRVEEVELPEVAELLTLKVTKTDVLDSEAVVNFATTGSRVLVILNNALLGMTVVENGVGLVTIDELDTTKTNTLTLVPLGEDVRGEGVEIILNIGYGGVGAKPNLAPDTALKNAPASIPKAPNTGKH